MPGKRPQIPEAERCAPPRPRLGTWITAVFAAVFLAAACGSDQPAQDQVLGISVDALDADTTCLATDPDCDTAASSGEELPNAVGIADPDEDGVGIAFGGFLYSDGAISLLCSALIESDPPQCSATIIELNAPIDVVLEHVADSFGTSTDAKINTEQGVFWTDEWINLSGVLENNRLVLDS